MSYFKKAILVDVWIYLKNWNPSEHSGNSHHANLKRNNKFSLKYALFPKTFVFMSPSNFWEMITIICQIDRVTISSLMLVTCYHSIYIHNLPTSMFFSFLRTIVIIGSAWTNKSLKINLDSKTCWSWKLLYLEIVEFADCCCKGRATQIATVFFSSPFLLLLSLSFLLKNLILKAKYFLK